MSLKIGIVMGGYLDENGRIMDRTELNRRIAGLQKENKRLRFMVKKDLSWDNELHNKELNENTSTK